jgi:hypothetical protein
MLISTSSEFLSPFLNSAFITFHLHFVMLRGRTLSALGDPLWVSASPHFAKYAPLVVLSLLVLSIIQIALGTVWVSKLQPYVTLYVLWLFLSPVKGHVMGEGYGYNRLSLTLESTI